MVRESLTPSLHVKLPDTLAEVSAPSRAKAETARLKAQASEFPEQPFAAGKMVHFRVH
jgi:hypothetical protein